VGRGSGSRCRSDHGRQRGAGGARCTRSPGGGRGDSLIIGQANLGTSQTSLAITGTSSANPLFQVDASLSTSATATAITGISNVGAGCGVAGGSSGSGGFGVFGRSTGTTGGTGVKGVSLGTSGVGVFGESGSGYGVYGHSSASYGVYGQSDSSTGVYGYSGGTNGVGVYAYSFSLDLWAAGTGRIRQNLQGSAGSPMTGVFSAGEQVRDANGDLYLCVASGSPGGSSGTWKKVAAIPAGTPGGALVFLSKPFRIFDTRPGVPGCPIDPAAPMANGQVTTLQITGTASTTDSTLVVPTGAIGIVGDLLAINSSGNGIDGSGQGFLTLQPHSGTPTGNSYLHYYPNQIIHNSVVIGLDNSGKLDVGNYNASTNVGLDILGYVS